MLNIEKIPQYVDNWAYDIPIKSLSRGEIVNTDVINQSIEMILATPRGSRLFNISYGSNFTLRVFDNMNEGSLEKLIDDTIVAINRWENRIIILEDQVQLTVDTDKHTIHLLIPYIIKQRQIKGEFSKIIKQ